MPQTRELPRQVSVGLPPDVLTNVKAVAAREGLSESAVIRRSVLHWLRDHAPERVSREEGHSAR